MLRILMLSAAAIIGLSGAASAQSYSWKPTKPIRIIVPWGAGGSTDQLVRVLAAEIEGALGQTVVVVNQAGGDYKMVTYDGGNPAVQAAVSGEAQITTQLIAEQYQMLRAKKLVPLAAYTNEDVTLDGIGTIPSIKKALPKIAAGPVHFGIWVPKDAPKEVIATMNQVWDSKIKSSDRLKKYAESAGLTVLVTRGDEAYKAAFPVVQINAWAIHDGGKSKVSPDKVGIPKPN